MITNKDIDDAWIRFADEFNKRVTELMVEHLEMQMTKTPEEYEAWCKERERKLKREEDLARTTRSIADLKGKLAYEEKHLEWLLNHE